MTVTFPVQVITYLCIVGLPNVVLIETMSSDLDLGPYLKVNVTAHCLLKLWIKL